MLIEMPKSHYSRSLHTPLGSIENPCQEHQATAWIYICVDLAILRPEGPKIII